MILTPFRGSIPSCWLRPLPHLPQRRPPLRLPVRPARALRDQVLTGRYVAVDGSSRMALAAAGADGRLLGREDRAHREPDSAAARRTRSGGGRVVKPKGGGSQRG